MKNRYSCRHLLHSLRLCPTLLGLATLATSALAAPTIYNNADPYSILDDDLSLRNTTNSSGGIQADGSILRHKGCTATNGPGTGDCFVFDPAQVPAPTTWHQRPQNYTYAAAQAFTSYGVNKARSWSIGPTIPFDQNDSTTLEYIGSAESQYQEEISYFGTAPTLVTFKLHLTGAWNDGGRFRLALGGLQYDPDGQPRYQANTVYTNCPPMSQCISEDGYHPFFNSNLFYVAGNDAANTNGSVDQFIDFTMLLHAFNPLTGNAINRFGVSLRTYASDAGAEMDAFSTLTLDSITVQPGVSLTFGSGTNYNVLIAGDPTVPPNGVPEPGAPLLLLTGLAAMWGSRRMRK
jgi:hypothetical protein